MPGLVHGDVFRVGHAGGREPPRSGSEQRRVLHAVGAALPRGIDDGDVAVGVRAEPFAVVAQGRPRCGEVARRLLRVLGLQQQPHANARQAGVAELLDSFDVVRAGRPREVVHVLRVVVVRRRAVAFVARRRAFRSRRADGPALGDGQADIVDAEVGEELGRGMKLVAVPARVLKNADLWKPLPEEIEVADGTGARERARHA